MASKTSDLIGYGAITLTVLLWAGFALTASYTQASPLSVADVAVLRVAFPMFVFICWLPSRWVAIRQAGWINCSMIATGAGLPFFWVVVYGGGATSAAHVASIIAGTVPFVVTGLVWWVDGIRPSRLKITGLCVMALGVTLLVLGNDAVDGGSAIGIGLLLAAGVSWRTFTFCLRQSGLDPIATVLVIALPSSAGLLILFALGSVETNWGNFTFADALPFVLIQGIGVAIVASLTFAIAIRHIGPERVSTIAALTPAVTAVLAVPFLGDVLGAVIGVAVCVVCVGVVLANRR